MLYLLSSVFVLLALSQVCRPCKVANWKPMTVGEQAATAEIIVYGTVKAHYPMPDVPGDRAYIAEMDVSCVMKGEELPPKINISEAGELTSCHHTLLPVDGTYIAFIKRDRAGMLVPDEVNHLSVAFDPTWRNFMQVIQAVDDAGSRCPQYGDLVTDTGDGGATALSCSAIYIVAMTIVARLLLNDSLWIGL